MAGRKSGENRAEGGTMTEEKDQPVCRVVYEDEERTGLLGLMIGDLLQRRLADPVRNKKCRKLKGDVELKAGKMHVNLSFGGDEVVVGEKAKNKPRARVAGDLHSLTGVVLGKALVGPYLGGRIKVVGNIFFLLKMLPVIRNSDK